jgi:C4-dicarboxylate transporter DctQ subunit
MKMLFERLPRLIIGALMLFALVIEVANVVARYVLRAPFIWAEEILVFVMIWIIFIGIILVSGNQAHLKMDLVAAAFPDRFSRPIALAGELVTFVVCVIMAYASSQVLITLGSYGQRSVVAEIPMVIPHVAVPLSFVVIGLLHFVHFVRKLRSRL